MYFSKEDRKAIYVIARAMVFADGNVDENELGALMMEMARTGSSQDEVLEFEEGIENSRPSDAIACIAGFDDEKKKYVCAFLGALTAVDGDVNDDEIELWSLTSHFCDLPTMSVREALDYMSKL